MMRFREQDEGISITCEGRNIVQNKSQMATDTLSLFCSLLADFQCYETRPLINRLKCAVSDRNVHLASRNFWNCTFSLGAKKKKKEPGRARDAPSFPCLFPNDGKKKKEPKISNKWRQHALGHGCSAVGAGGSSEPHRRFRHDGELLGPDG